MKWDAKAAPLLHQLLSMWRRLKAMTTKKGLCDRLKEEKVSEYPYRCAMCNKLQYSDSIRVYVPDGVRIGDPAWSVKLHSLNGTESAWCTKCAMKLRRRSVMSRQMLRDIFILFLIAWFIMAIIVLTGCATTTYTAPDGTQFSRTSLFSDTDITGLRVHFDSKNGIKRMELDDSSTNQTKALEAAARGAAQGAKGGL